jgi:hypothetical protein
MENVPRLTPQALATPLVRRCIGGASNVIELKTRRSQYAPETERAQRKAGKNQWVFAAKDEHSGADYAVRQPDHETRKAHVVPPTM